VDTNQRNCSCECSQSMRLCLLLFGMPRV